MYNSDEEVVKGSKSATAVEFKAAHRISEEEKKYRGQQHASLVDKETFWDCCAQQTTGVT